MNDVPMITNNIQTAASKKLGAANEAGFYGAAGINPEANLDNVLAKSKLFNQNTAFRRNNTGMLYGGGKAPAFLTPKGPAIPGMPGIAPKPKMAGAFSMKFAAPPRGLYGPVNQIPSPESQDSWNLWAQRAAGMG